MPTLSRRTAPFLALVLLMLPVAGSAAEIDGRTLSVWWGMPFGAMLLSIAVVPLFAPLFWHHHFGKVTALWALAFIVPFTWIFGAHATLSSLVHVAVGEYIPFIILLSALFVIAGGIYIRGNLKGSTRLNLGILATGAVLASFMGTTGASMLLIRPLIRANDNRRHAAHVVVFFIFIVANAGGSLTPLGDPPLFLGFLQGVDFFWTVKHLFGQTVFLIAVLLVIFGLIDAYRYRKDGVKPRDPTPDTPTFGFEGRANFLLLAGVVALVLTSGLWKSGIAFSISGTPVTWAGLLRDLGLIALALISMRVTPDSVHEQNRFSWGPMAEVAKLFAGIFVTIIPAIAMLRAGVHGPFGPIVAAVTSPDGQPLPAMYFWAAGMLSSFLDNAPTYLVFFNTAGGDPAVLMTSLASTLAAVSAGSVFMGANTYIGNAPNLMVKAIAEHRGIRMPGFFGYMVWSLTVLVPLFALMTYLWF